MRNLVQIYSVSVKGCARRHGFVISVLGLEAGGTMGLDGWLASLTESVSFRPARDPVLKN